MSFNAFYAKRVIRKRKVPYIRQFLFFIFAISVFAFLLLLTTMANINQAIYLLDSPYQSLKATSQKGSGFLNIKTSIMTVHNEMSSIIIDSSHNATVFAYGRDNDIDFEQTAFPKRKVIDGPAPSGLGAGEVLISADLSMRMNLQKGDVIYLGDSIAFGDDNEADRPMPFTVAGFLQPSYPYYDVGVSGGGMVLLSSNDLISLEKNYPASQNVYFDTSDSGEGEVIYTKAQEIQSAFDVSKVGSVAAIEGLSIILLGIIIWREVSHAVKSRRRQFAIMNSYGYSTRGFLQCIAAEEMLLLLLASSLALIIAKELVQSVLHMYYISWFALVPVLFLYMLVGAALVAVCVMRFRKQVDSVDVSCLLMRKDVA